MCKEEEKDIAGVQYQVEQLNTLIQSSPEIMEQLISSTLVMCKTIHVIMQSTTPA